MDRDTWLERILEAVRDLGDASYQERVWVRGEGPEVDSGTEAICRLVDDYDLATFLTEAANDAWLSHAQLAMLRGLDAALARCAGNGENADDATRIASRGWQKIRELAQATLETFPTPTAGT